VITGSRRTSPITVVLWLAAAWGAALIAFAALWHPSGGTTDQTLLQADGLVGMAGASTPLLVSLLVAWCLRWSPPGWDRALLAVAWVLTGAVSLFVVLAAFAFGPFLVPTGGLLIAACAMTQRAAELRGMTREGGRGPW
jgi:hypothetical protein